MRIHSARFLVFLLLLVAGCNAGDHRRELQISSSEEVKEALTFAPELQGKSIVLVFSDDDDDPSDGAKFAFGFQLAELEGHVEELLTNNMHVLKVEPDAVTVLRPASAEEVAAHYEIEPEDADPRLIRATDHVDSNSNSLLFAFGVRGEPFAVAVVDQNHEVMDLTRLGLTKEQLADVLTRRR